MSHFEEKDHTNMTDAKEVWNSHDTIVIMVIRLVIQ